MIKLTDGRKTVEIEMKVWDDYGVSPDWSCDFFNIGALPYDPDLEAYIVPDVNYCIDQAEDWKAGVGDYSDELEGCPGHNPDDRIVDTTAEN